MKKIILLFCVIILLGCKSKQTPTEKSDSLPPQANTKVDTTSTIKTPSNNPNALPPEVDIDIAGDVYSVSRWEDKNGKNLLVLSSNTNSVEEADAGVIINTTELFAILYLEKNGKYVEYWKMYDLVKECTFDITADFLGKPEIMDLDNDNEKEIFISYKLACRSDVSPSTLKIIGHEGKTKFGLRGSMWVPMGEGDSLPIETEPDLSKISDADGESTFGRYENSMDFNSQPKVFLEYARQRWIDQRVETF